MDIYELLNKIIINKNYTLSSNLFIDEDRNTLNESDKKIFDTIKNISSIKIKPSIKEVSFHPTFVSSDGTRSFSIDDISDEDYSLLSTLDFNKIPYILRAQITDILWSKRKNHNVAIIAADSYWNLFKLFYNNNDLIKSIGMIQRAICISLSIKQSKLYDEIKNWFNTFINSDSTKKNIFFTLRLMDLFYEQKDYDSTIFVNVLDSICKEHYDEISIYRQASSLKYKCLSNSKRNKEAQECMNDLADYYMYHATTLTQDTLHNLLNAEELIKKAIQIYRNHGNSTKASLCHETLLKIQSKLPENIPNNSVHFDATNIINYLKDTISELSFEECIIFLTQLLTFEKEEDIRKRVIQPLEDNPLFQIIHISYINEKGQAKLKLPPLDLQNPNKDQDLLEKHMFRSLLQRQDMTGDVIFKNALNMIRERFPIDKSMLDFLIKDNIIIPEGRENIFRSGIYMFLIGDYYEALHILAPQVENLFRNIVEMANAIPVTLENDGTSKEKVLSSIFSSEELLDCYDNDIVFTFRGLLIEQAGANIRNNIAHGIIDEKSCCNGSSIYFGVAVIKLISLTSTRYYEIYEGSNKLKNLTTPNYNV